jgi:cell division protein FtsQ
MKKLANLTMHIKWRRIAWLAAAVCICVLSLQAVDFRDVQKVKQADIVIDQSNGLFFIDSADVMELLHSQRVYPGTSLVQSVPTERLEKVLEGSPYCHNAEVYIDATGVLHVDVRQRIPIVRIINTRGVGYYLDATGTKLPLSDKFTARVLATNGFVRASDNNADTTGDAQLEDVLNVATALQSDAFLSRLIDQVWVNEKREFVLVPKFTKQEVLLGSANALDKKLSKLNAFYRHTATNSLSNYKRIDLQYQNEIYATRRDFIPAPVAVTAPDTTHTPH